MPSVGQQDKTVNAVDPSLFRRKFRNLILLAWILPPVIGLSFIVFIDVLSPGQLLKILITPSEPLYIIGWLFFALWYFLRFVEPLFVLQHQQRMHDEQVKSGVQIETPPLALDRLRTFPMHFWGIFLLYLLLAPASVILSAEYFTDYVARPVDWFRIQMIALIVSIIVGLPIFFLIYDLFGRALGHLRLHRVFVSIRAKVFMIGALVPLLIDTMLVQYYWTRTGYFTMETFLVWLALEVLAIIGSLIFIRSFGQSLSPLRELTAAEATSKILDPQVLLPRSTDELGLLSADYRELVEELQFKNNILLVNNRLLNIADKDEALGDLLDAMLTLCQRTIYSDKVFLMLYDQDRDELLGVAQSGEGYNPDGHYSLPLDANSTAVWAFRQARTIVINDCLTDTRVSAEMRERFKVAAALATPLIRDARPVGVLMVISNTQHNYTDRETRLMESAAQEMTIAIHTRYLQQQSIDKDKVLQQNREHFQRLVESSNSIPWELDLETWRFTYVGPQAVSILGYPIDQWYQEGFWQDHIVADDRDAAVDHYVSATKRGLDYEFEYRMLAADGRIVWIRDSVNIIFQDGKRAMLQGFMFDITRQKQEQEARRQSEEKFSRVFHTSPVAILISRIEDGMMLDINQSFEQLLGYTLQDIKGKTTVDIGLWLNPEERARLIQQIVEKGKVQDKICTLVTHQGKHIQCQFSAHSIELDGESCMVVVAQDVTDRNRIEKTIRTLAESTTINDYRQFLHTVICNLAEVYQVQHAFVGTLMPDRENIQVTANWAAGGIADNFIYPLTDTPCQDVLDGKKGLIFANARQLYPQDELLQRLEIDSYYAAPLRASDGSLLGIVVVMDSKPMNIMEWAAPILKLFANRIAAEMERQMVSEELETYRHNLEDLVALRTAKMEQLNRELESFCYSVSHDLRAPLRSINGFTHILMEDYGKQIDRQGQDYLGRVSKGASRMSELIDDLLDLSRVARSEPDMEKLDLSKMASEVVAELREHDPDRNITIDIQPGMHVYADRRLLKIVLDNLVGNAWKYTSRNENARIDIGVMNKAKQQVYYIRDNGVGFDMQYVDKLFGAFQRLHHQDEFEGTGIGLATVQRIISHHSGRVWAEAETGKGATFYFTLPDGGIMHGGMDH